jgi:hypothetical protein
MPLYTVARINTATGEPFGDGEHILYVNGSYRGDDEIGKLMHDFSCSEASDMIIPDMAEITRYYKETEEGRQTVCKVMEDMRNDVKAETELNTTVKHLKDIMASLKLTIDQAMDALKIPQDDREKYLSRI